MAKRGDVDPVDLPYVFKVLWFFLKRYKPYLFGLIILIFLVEALVFLDNFIFKFLVDKANIFGKGLITADEFTKLIILAVSVFFILKIFDAASWYLRIYLINRIDGNLMSDVEKRSFWHIINLSYRFHLNKRTGSIISKFTRGVSKVETLVDAFVFNFFPVIFRVGISVSVIFYFDALTAIILTIMIIAFVIFGVFITDKQKIPQHTANEREDVLKQNLSDVFLNIETVKYFGKEKPTFAYFRNLSHKLKQSRLHFWDLFSWFSSVTTLIIGAGIAAIFYFSFISFRDGNITLGSITLIYAAVWRLLPHLFGLMHGYREFVRASVDVSALFEVFKEKNEVVDISDAKKLKVKDGEIEFKKVTFAYPSKIKDNAEAVMKDFNLKIKKNMKVALVGPSGGGKTTIIKLLYRLFDINEGEIIIDGQDIKKITQESLRNNMSVVPQEPLLFDNSIYFNIAYANPKASPKKVWAAIRFAQLDRFIKQLPYKEKTLVGERGVKLSGGEKQRVSIARAILADKKILVLDEATSALDSETEKEIQRDLEKLMKGRTTVIIAHRLSTIMKADAIVVINKGAIVEIGSHKKLTNKRGGLYRRLWSLQQGGRL